MKLDEVRADLRCARERALAGDVATAVDRIERVLQDLGPDRLLTTAEAAALLGVRSVNTVKLWCRNGTLTCATVGSRTMVPLSEVERARERAPVRAIRASDRLHDASADLGEEAGLDDDQLHELAAARPGALPWQRSRAR